MKTAFVFPGQGSQYIGMAQDFLAANPSLAEVLTAFDAEHNTVLAQAMREGPEDLLKQTHLTQPAILLHSIAAYQAFQKEYDIIPEYVAGHSLGEFTALVASGVLSLKDALHLVHKRGEYMIQAVGDTPFAMAAVIGLDAQAVIDVCAEASTAGLVQAVNFNTPIQTVISGTATGVAKAGELAKAAGAKRVLPLVVGGPFHTPLIGKASTWLAEEMQKLEFKDGKIPVISNLDVMPSVDGAEIREKLAQQIISPVRWVESVIYMKEHNVERFIEFGPQKVLSGMIKNIDKDALCFNLDRMQDMLEIKEVLN